MLKLHRKKMDIYPITFWFSLDAKRLQDKGNFEIEQLAGGATYCEGLNVYIWLDSEDFKIVIPDMVHECFHAAMFTASILGLNPTVEQHECTAYLSGWFSGKILDFINEDIKSNKED